MTQLAFPACANLIAPAAPGLPVELYFYRYCPRHGSDRYFHFQTEQQRDEAMLKHMRELCAERYADEYEAAMDSQELIGLLGEHNHWFEAAESSVEISALLEATQVLKRFVTEHHEQGAGSNHTVNQARNLLTKLEGGE